MNVSTAEKPATGTVPPGTAGAAGPAAGSATLSPADSAAAPATNTTGRRRLLPVSGKRPGPVAVTLLFSLGWVFMYADRNILSPVMSVIQDQWGLTRASWASCPRSSSSPTP